MPKLLWSEEVDEVGAEWAEDCCDDGDDCDGEDRRYTTRRRTSQDSGDAVGRALLFMVLPVLAFKLPELDRRFRTTKAVEECASWGNKAAAVYTLALAYNYFSIGSFIWPVEYGWLSSFVVADSIAAALLPLGLAWASAFAFMTQIEKLYARMVKIALFDQGRL